MVFENYRRLVTKETQGWREDLINKEWLLTNGIGGYASGTIAGANTRSHHGILVASFSPPAERKVLIGKVEERVLYQESYYDLSTNLYPGVIHPDGTQYLKAYQVSPNPRWEYTNGDWELEKNILMLQGSNSTVVTYINKGRSSFYLEIHPLYSFSDHQMVFRENSFSDFYTEFKAKAIKTYPHYGSRPVYTCWDLGEYVEARSWYKNVLLPVNKERGLDAVCDYYRIGYVKHLLKPSQEIRICFSDEERILEKSNRDLGPLPGSDVMLAEKGKKCNFYKDLLAAGDQFLVHRQKPQGKAIIAGYHWFEVWGRDTLIAMRGLTMARENKEVTESIINSFLIYLDRGMIPNRFPEHGFEGIPYNTMDASLWMFVVLYDYHNYFKDLDFIKKHFSCLREILDHHLKGTRYNIHVTPEGFLYGGGQGDDQLTWMDAKIDGKAITPRVGCPVEINSLWYNALKIYQFFGSLLHLEMDPAILKSIALFEQNFPRFFLNEEGTLYDVVIPNILADNAFRPNQIYALSLPFSVLKSDQQKRIFKAIEKKLYSPFGLRTLSMDDPKFQGVYKGNQWERDHAYHQGSIWPFLIYEYFHAYFKLFGGTPENKKYVINELSGLKDHFYNKQGLHCISEIFDGLEPANGKGCIHQAWSVAALVKLYADYRLYEIEGQ